MKNLNHAVSTEDMVQIVSTVAFISEAHKGQKYGNMPYMFHPMEVATEVNSASTDEYIAALLHDVVEDTEYTEDNLRERYNDAVVDMVMLLTLKDPDYRANIQRIIDSGNVGAMKVKLADNRVNRRGDKSMFKPAKAQKLNDRYDMSIEMLTAELERKELQAKDLLANGRKKP